MSDEGRPRPDRPPEFVIIGAQRSGTTSLFDALMHHSRVTVPTRREVHYFDLNYWRGRRWYLRRFRRPPGMWSGESSPYYLYHPAVPARLARDLPAARLIVLVRDPIERAWSQHQHNLATGRDELPFVEALAAERSRIDGQRPPRRARHRVAHRDHAYAARGDYVRQLDRWVDAVGRDRLLVVPSARLYQQPTQTHEAVLRHLGLPVEPLPAPHRHRSPEVLSASVRRQVAPFFPYDEAELFERYGVSYH